MWHDVLETQEMGDTERLSVLIPSELKQEFEALCKLERRSMSAQVVLLIEQAVQEAKDQGRLQPAKNK
jgi:metal-responsive CopG/Arc/MetJ family transcriptional regulator